MEEQIINGITILLMFGNFSFNICWNLISLICSRLQVYFNHLPKYKLAIWTCERKQTNFTIEKCKHFTDLENQQRFGPSLLHWCIYFSIFWELLKLYALHRKGFILGFVIYYKYPPFKHPSSPAGTIQHNIISRIWMSSTFRKLC